jgi:hypothetical protein
MGRACSLLAHDTIVRRVRRFPHRGLDALLHAPLGLGGSVSPTPLSSSFT